MISNDILDKARTKYPEYASREDGDHNYFEVMNDMVVFWEYDEEAEWSEPIELCHVEDV